MYKSNLSLTVGITTCYGDNSILDTVKSLRVSNGVVSFRFIIVADRTPINPWLKKQLKRYDVELIENQKEGSQIVKQRQILKMCRSDILILTQDDVLFKPQTLAVVMKYFADHPNTTLLSIRNQPVKATNHFESILEVGTNIANRIAKDWNHGNNYLANVGRFMAFRASWLKKNFQVSTSVTTTDAYFYFDNQTKGGEFVYLPEVEVYFKNPQNMIEHLRKSSRFKYSQLEMTRYHGRLQKSYRIPLHIGIKAVSEEFINHPLKTLAYLAINLYTWIKKLQPEAVLNPVWEVDLSTKKVISV